MKTSSPPLSKTSSPPYQKNFITKGVQITEAISSPVHRECHAIKNKTCTDMVAEKQV